MSEQPYHLTSTDQYLSRINTGDTGRLISFHHKKMMTSITRTDPYLTSISTGDISYRLTSIQYFSFKEILILVLDIVGNISAKAVRAVSIDTAQKERMTW